MNLCHQVLQVNTIHQGYLNRRPQLCLITKFKAGTICIIMRELLCRLLDYNFADDKDLFWLS